MLKHSFFTSVWVILLIWTMPTIALAEMSEQELRLQALEEKQEANARILEILQRFSWYGDLRTRWQSESTEQSGVLDERDRARIRLRVGAQIHMFKNLDIGFRMSTAGLTSRDSGNQTLDGGFTHRAFDLDLAYFKYTPNLAGWKTTLHGGKFKPPFMKSEIIWDSDVTPEGISEQFSQKFGNTVLDANFGQFMYDELNPGDDILILGYQGVITQKTDIGKFKIAVAYYDVTNAEDPNSDFSGNGGFLDTTDEVKMLDIMTEWSEKIAGNKLKLFGEYTQNVGKLTEANQDQDTAWQVGAKYGKSGKKFGDYDLKVIYRVVQAASVLDSISDSDFHGGRSNARGFEFGGGFGLAKGVKVSLTYFDTREEQGADRNNQTFQADLKFKF
ncbi:MAG: hypothetical protein HOF21_14825 [Nitrospina sp.]|nr:hypothetical protein [Nitrospina sp.]MBT5633244.1 hypothetical protein [Nitrospina sp.]